MLVYLKIEFRICFLMTNLLKERRDLTKSMKGGSLQELRVAQTFKKFFSIRSDPSGKQSPEIFIISSSCFLSFGFTDINYSFSIRWLSEIKAPTFHKPVCNVLAVLGKWDENWGGMTQYRMSLLGFHTSHCLFKYMFLVKMMCFLEDCFLFSLAETELTFNKMNYI